MSDYNDKMVAAARIVAGVFVGERVGFANSISVAASVWTLTLGTALSQIDRENAVAKCTGTGATPGLFTVTWINDSQITVSTFDDAGAAADRDFQIEIRRRAIG